MFSQQAQDQEQEDNYQSRNSYSPGTPTAQGEQELAHLSVVDPSHFGVVPHASSRHPARTLSEDSSGDEDEEEEEIPDEDADEDEDDDYEEETKKAGGRPAKRRRVAKVAGKTGAAPGGKGRKKILIEYIEVKDKRFVSFSKRKAGLLKKAYELATLTGTEIAVLIVAESGQLHSFATNRFIPFIHGDLDAEETPGQKMVRYYLNCPERSPLDSMYGIPFFATQRGSHGPPTNKPPLGTNDARPKTSRARAVKKPKGSRSKAGTHVFPPVTECPTVPELDVPLKKISSEDAVASYRPPRIIKAAPRPRSAPHPAPSAQAPLEAGPSSFKTEPCYHWPAAEPLGPLAMVVNNAFPTEYATPESTRAVPRTFMNENLHVMLTQQEQMHDPMTAIRERDLIGEHASRLALSQSSYDAYTTGSSYLHHPAPMYAPSPYRSMGDWQLGETRSGAPPSGTFGDRMFSGFQLPADIEDAL